MATSRVTSDQKRLLTTLAELGGSMFDDDRIVNEGDRLILPRNMTMVQAVKFLRDRITAEEEEVQVSRMYKYRPWDGAMATWRVFKATFGAVNHKGTPGIFGDNPPEFKTVTVGPNETEQVPWGGFAIPMLPDTTFFTSGVKSEDLGVLFKLQVHTLRRWKSHVEGVLKLVEEELRQNSIYRGKAFDGKEMPDFLDLTGVSPEKVVYSAETMVQLEANVWAVMRHSKALREANIPLKRSALFYGPYGTGKTLGGFLTARYAIENGWTFIYARPGRDDLEEVMQTARLYQPACVFAEDLDTVSEGETADQASRLLDIFDGITAKGTELLVVLTTNHPDRIHKGMLRPGRLDAVIEIAALDPEGIKQLVNVSVPDGALSEHLAWPQVTEAMEGLLPAYIKEAADRAYRYALARTGGDLSAINLTTVDLVNAAHGLRPQLDLMDGAKERALPDPLAGQLRKTMQEALVQTIHPDATDGDRDPLLRREVVNEVLNGH